MSYFNILYSFSIGFVAVTKILLFNALWTEAVKINLFLHL